MPLEFKSHDTDPYAGINIPDPVDLPSAPEKEKTKDANTSLDSLAGTSAVRIDMTKGSLNARADIIKAAIKDPAFPVSMKFGYQSKDALPTLGGSAYENTLNPAYATGEKQYTKSVAELAKVDGSYQALLWEAQKIEGERNAIGGKINEWYVGFNAIELEYNAKGNRNWMEDSRDAWRSGKIMMVGGRYVVVDPSAQEIVDTFNKQLTYNKAHIIELYILENDLRNANKLLSQPDGLYDKTAAEYKLLKKADFANFDARVHRFQIMKWDRAEVIEKLFQNSQAFSKIFDKPYTLEESERKVLTALDSYWENIFSVYENANSEQFSTQAKRDAFVREKLVRIWSELSKEEKVIFLNILGSELMSSTYNKETAQTGKAIAIPTLGDQFFNLAQATYWEKNLPMSVCTGIHATVAQVANMWGIDAGVVTVGGKDLGHAITVMKVADKMVFSDYGKLYVGKNVEEALDTYAVKNNSYVFTNYLADDRGNIIGSIQTPLNREVNAQMFTMRDIESWIKKPATMPEGVELELTNRGKRIALNKHVGNAYAGVGYKENEISGLKLQTIHATLGFESGDELLRNFSEIDISKTRINSGKDKSRDYYGIAAQMGVSKTWPIQDTFSIETGVTAKGKVQLADKMDLSIGGLSKWQVGEVAVSGNVQANYKLDANTTAHVGVIHTRNIVPNLQSGASNIPNTYGSNTVYAGVTRKDEKGGDFGLSASHEITALASTSKVQTTLRDANISASAYAEIIKSTGKSPLGPSDSSRVGLEVTKKLGEWKDTRIDAFAGVRQDRIDGKSNGPVYNAGIKGTF